MDDALTGKACIRGWLGIVQDRAGTADAEHVTAAKPYRGRHSAPDDDDVNVAAADVATTPSVPTSARPPASAEPRVFEARRINPHAVARPSLPPRLAALLAEPASSAPSTVVESPVDAQAAVEPAALENPVVENPALKTVSAEPAAAPPAVVLPPAATPGGSTQNTARAPLFVPERVPDRPTPAAGLAAMLAVDEPAAGEWVAYTPPPVVQAPRQPATWDTPAGFVPLRPPPRGRSSALNYVAIGVVVAAVAALGWFGYQAFFKTTPKGAVGAAPAAAVTYTSPDGHFTVGLPAQPVTSTYAQSYGAYHLQASMASVPGAREVAAGLVVTPSIPAEHMSEFMQGAVSGFARNGHLANIASTTYEGHPAITATGTTTDGATVQMLFYAYSSTRMYMLMAPDAASMTALESQFRPTP